MQDRWMIKRLGKGVMLGGSLVASWVFAADPSVSFSLDDSGQVSLGIYNARGQQVRELLRGDDLAAGKHEVVWDGRNGRGEPVPAGEYEWRLLRSEGLTARYLTSLGVNPSWFRRPPGKWVEHWIGDHAGPGSVAVDETGIYVASRMTEGLHMTLKMSLDGKRRIWSQPQYYQQAGQTLDSAVNDRFYFVLQPNSQLRLLHSKNGATATRVDVRAEDKHAVRIDANDSYALLVYPDLLQWRAMKNLNVVAGSVTLPGVKLAAIRPNNQAYAVTDAGELFDIDLSARSAQLLSKGFKGCTAIDVDANDLLFAALNRKGFSLIGCFTDELKIVKRYGGRTRGSGPHDALRFSHVSDLSADLPGGLLVVETHPARRVAAYHKRTGKPLREWYGGHSFYVDAQVDPCDPTRIFGPSPEGWINAWRIDYDTGRTKLDAAWAVGSLLDGLFPFHYGNYKPFYVDDDLHFFFSSIPAVLRLDTESQQLVPVAMTGRVHNGPYRLNNHFRGGNGQHGFPKPWADAVLAKGHSDVRAVSPFFAWVDENLNGKLEPDEMTIEDDPGVHLFNAGAMTADGDLVYGDGRHVFYRLPNLAQSGLPRWRWSTVEAVATVPEHLANMFGVRGTYIDDAGYYYGSMQSGVLIRDHGQYEGGGWPEMAITKARFMKYSPEGEVMFEAGRATKHRPDAGSGQLFYPMQVFGGPDDTVIVNDQTVQAALAWSQDGLFIGTMLDHRVDDGLPDGVYQTQGDDNQGGACVQLDDGRVFWICPYQGFMPVYKITGWDKIERQEGALRLKQAAAPLQRAGTGLTGYYYASTGDEDPVVTRVDPQIVFSWGHEAPVEGANHNRFKVVWEGEIEIPTTDEYTFEVWKDGDDKFRLTIGGKEVMNSTSGRTATETTDLKSGRQPIRIEFEDRIGPASVRLFWWGRNQDREEVPTALLYPAGP